MRHNIVLQSINIMFGILNRIKRRLSANSIFTIIVENKRGALVFTDLERGLIDEPFVSGADEVIKTLKPELRKNGAKAPLTFASSMFPGATHEFERQESEWGGHWYSDGEMRGWLCPALLKFFSKAPAHIFVQA